MITLMSCSITSRPIPSAALTAASAPTSSSASDSLRPAAGSSRSRNEGRVASALAIAEPPCLVMGQPAGGEAGPMLELDSREQLGRNRASAPPGSGNRECGDFHVLEAREARKEPDVLERADEPRAGDPCLRPGRDVAAVEHDDAGRDALETREGVDERRLAGAVRPDQAEDLPVAKRQIDPVHRPHASDVHPNVAGLEGSGGHHGASFSR